MITEILAVAITLVAVGAVFLAAGAGILKGLKQFLCGLLKCHEVSPLRGGSITAKENVDG
jgi:hypothetical protein